MKIKSEKFINSFSKKHQVFFAFVNFSIVRGIAVIWNRKSQGFNLKQLVRIVKI